MGLIKDDITGLKELPDTTEKISSALTAYAAVVINCRCFFLAACHCAAGKMLEAAALMDMLPNRMDDMVIEATVPGPCARLHPLFERVAGGMRVRVGMWRCRILAQLCTEASSKKKEA